MCHFIKDKRHREKQVPTPSTKEMLESAPKHTRRNRKQMGYRHHQNDNHDQHSTQQKDQVSGVSDQRCNSTKSTLDPKEIHEAERINKNLIRKQQLQNWKTCLLISKT